ncbi:MAG: ribosomal-processing cysteine protease Prp [Oscillospiraceae bacterium]|jgi:hypothetical protein
MITAEFIKSGSAFIGFCVSGHSGFSDSGKDIVCAAVASAVQYCSNTITDCFNVRADVKVLENIIRLKLPPETPAAEKMIEGLFVHLNFLAEDYKGTIKITTSEV